MALERVLSTLDKALTEYVGDFDIATAAVDAITVKYRGIQKDKACGLQILTYISRPLDLVIQIVVSPIFILYQTGKDIYLAFKKHGPLAGIGVIALTPFNLVWKAVSNILSTNFISTPINMVLPLGTCLDFIGPNRHLVRIVEMERFGLFEEKIRNDAILTEIKRRLEIYQAKAIKEAELETQDRYGVVTRIIFFFEKSKMWDKFDDPDPVLNPPQNRIVHNRVRITESYLRVVLALINAQRILAEGPNIEGLISASPAA